MNDISKEPKLNQNRDFCVTWEKEVVVKKYRDMDYIETEMGGGAVAMNSKKMQPSLLLWRTTAGRHVENKGARRVQLSERYLPQEGG